MKPKERMNVKGYIYIRNHSSYDEHGVYKLGATEHFGRRDLTYKTGEFTRGKYVMIIEVPKDRMFSLEKIIQRYFKNYSRKRDGGSEFFSREILTEIMNFFKEIQIEHRLLTEEEIEEILKETRLQEMRDSWKTLRKHFVSFLDKKRIQRMQTSSLSIRPYQEEIIQKTITYFEENPMGVLVLMCGVGKTLISLWTCQRMGLRRILIGVPNIMLLEQWSKEVSRVYSNLKESQICKVCDTMEIEDIQEFLQENVEECIVITTYQSAFKVYQATETMNFYFDMKILDECHHITCKDIRKVDLSTSREYVISLHILSERQLSLTATLKDITNDDNQAEVVSNLSEKYFGKTIETRCLHWAIRQNIVCDYEIHVIETLQSEMMNHSSNMITIRDGEELLYLSAYSALESMKKGMTHHLLVYCNSTDHANQICKYIRQWLRMPYFDELKHNVFYGNYHSRVEKEDLKRMMNRFQSSSFGILTCVYSLGEGWDFPVLDGVVFAENMTSSIRIVQSALRSGRKNKMEPEKINKLIIPVLNLEDLTDREHSDFKRVREIVWQMGWEDENVIEKIHFSKPKDPISNPGGVGRPQTPTEIDKRQLILEGLKRIERPEGISFSKAKKILQERQIHTREAYETLCDEDNRFPKDPEERYPDHFHGWVDYLSIPRIYYSKNECIRKVQEYLEKRKDLYSYSLNLAYIASELSKMDERFPPKGLWVEYYKVNDIRCLIEIEEDEDE